VRSNDASSLRYSGIMFLSQTRHAAPQQNVWHGNKRKVFWYQTFVHSLYHKVSISADFSTLSLMDWAKQKCITKLLLKARTKWRNWTELNSTELTWFSFWRTDQWASSNALQEASSKASILLTTDLARPLVSWSKTKPCQFSSVQLRRFVSALREISSLFKRVTTLVG